MIYQNTKGGDRMPLKIFKGNLLNAKQDVIVHQVNCQGSFGAGLAKQIADKYPKAKREYMEYCKTKKDINLLGDCLITETIDYDIANLFGQLYYGSYGDYYNEHGRQTDYKALEYALDTLKRITKGKTIAFPYGIGCGLANGEWSEVKSLIRDTFTDQTVWIYKLEE
jgi:O-acetyl-ADP-ribose deacetylase (regulator of RNase III)